MCEMAYIARYDVDKAYAGETVPRLEMLTVYPYCGYQDVTHVIPILASHRQLFHHCIVMIAF